MNKKEERQWDRAREHLGLGLVEGEEEDSSSPPNLGFFCLANSDVLTIEAQIQVVEMVQSMPYSELIYPLVLVCGPNPTSHVAFQLSNR